MTTRLMRNVDRYAGIPLCLATGVLSMLVRSRITGDREPENILVAKFFGLGSVLLSTPFLAALRARFPSARIWYLSFDSNRELIARIPELAGAMTISTASPGAFVATTLTTLRRLRRLNVDLAFDLEFFSKFSTLLLALSGARSRVGFSLPTRWRRWNLTASVRLDRSLHVSAVFLRQLNAAGIHVAARPPLPALASTERERISLGKKLRHLRYDGPIICVNVNAGETSLERRWDPERFAQVAMEVVRRHLAAHVCFTGNAAERPYVEEILERHPALRDHATNCAGLLSLGEFIALLERSRLLITNDSAPMHLAAAAGARTIALFGPESPRFYGPLRGGTTIYKALPCSPCLNVYAAKVFVCPYQAQCMRDISVDEVLTAIEHLVPASLNFPLALHETTS